jgi:hypothetical protein
MTSPPKTLFALALVVLAGIVVLGRIGLTHGIDGARATSHLRAAYIGISINFSRSAVPAPTPIVAPR